MTTEENGIGERLKEERLKLEMNQAEFAKATGVSTVSQGYYEQNRRKPGSDYLAKLAELKVDLVYVLTGNSSPSGKKMDIYKEPTDALVTVVNLQDDYGRFSGEQLKTLIEYAYRYQVDEQGMRSFLDSAYVIAGAKKPNNSNK